MQSNITTLNGVTIDWSCNIQSKVAADSTNAEVTAIYSTTKSTTGPILQQNWEFLRGHRFYPSPSTSHGSHLCTVPSKHTVLDSGK